MGRVHTVCALEQTILPECFLSLGFAIQDFVGKYYETEMTPLIQQIVLP